MKHVSALFLVLATFAAFASDSFAPTQAEIISYPNRTITEWGKEEAIREAEIDIKVGKPKLYLSGTRAVFAPGLTAEQRQKLRDLPTADAGIGCVIKDDEEGQLRKVQAQYAETYNRYVAEHYRP